MKYKYINIKLSLFLFASLCFYKDLNAAEQANFKQDKVYYIPHQTFSSNTQQGINYYGQNIRGNIDGITLVYENTAQQNNLEFLMPNIEENELFYVKNRRSIDVLNNKIKNVLILPFIIAAQTQNGNATNNTLMLNSARLSSMFFGTTNQTNDLTQKTSLIDDNNIHFSITAARALYGNAYNNSTYIKNTEIAMGWSDGYSLKSNGSVYLSGATSLFGDAKDNLLDLTGSKLFTKNSTYKQISLIENKFNTSENTFVGAGVAGGNAINNKVIFKDSYISLQGLEKSYSAVGTFYIIGADVNSHVDDKKHIAQNNSVLIENMKIESITQGKEKKNYHGILFGNIYGTRIRGKGDALNNSITIQNIDTFNKENNYKTQAYFNIFGGTTTDGEANGNKIKISLAKPIKTDTNFIGKHNYNIIAGDGTQGANQNNIYIKNRLTEVITKENNFDQFRIIAAQTLKGKANSNEIKLKDFASNIPLFVSAVSGKLAYDNKFFADEASKNIVSLNDIQSRRSLFSIIEAKNTHHNSINYNNVVSQSRSNSLTKQSIAIIRGTNKAYDNIININNYASISGNSTVVVVGEKEVYNNKIIINNAIFGVGADKKGGMLKLVGGLGENTHHNLLAINNISLDAFNSPQRPVSFAASAIPYGNENNVKSHDNILYIGGNFETDQGAYIDIISGAIRYEVDETKHSAIYLAPSKKELTAGNHLILDLNYIESRNVNNFEDYTFIFSSATDKTEPIIRAFDSPVNLSNNAHFRVYGSDADFFMGEKLIAITSEMGYSDIDGKVITSKNELDDLLEKISKNYKSFDYKQIPNLKEKKLNEIKVELESSQDLKTIYMKVTGGGSVKNEKDRNF